MSEWVKRSFSGMKRLHAGGGDGGSNKKLRTSSSAAAVGLLWGGGSHQRNDRRGYNMVTPQTKNLLPADSSNSSSTRNSSPRSSTPSIVVTGFELWWKEQELQDYLLSCMEEHYVLCYRSKRGYPITSCRIDYRSNLAYIELQCPEETRQLLDFKTLASKNYSRGGDARQPPPKLEIWPSASAALLSKQRHHQHQSPTKRRVDYEQHKYREYHSNNENLVLMTNSSTAMMTSTTTFTSSNEVAHKKEKNPSTCSESSQHKCTASFSKGEQKGSSPTPRNDISLDMEISDDDDQTLMTTTKETFTGAKLIEAPKRTNEVLGTSNATSVVTTTALGGNQQAVANNEHDVVVADCVAKRDNYTEEEWKTDDKTATLVNHRDESLNMTEKEQLKDKATEGETMAKSTNSETELRDLVKSLREELDKEKSGGKATENAHRRELESERMGKASVEKGLQETIRRLQGGVETERRKRIFFQNALKEEQRNLAESKLLREQDERDLRRQLQDEQETTSNVRQELENARSMKTLRENELEAKHQKVKADYNALSKRLGTLQLQLESANETIMKYTQNIGKERRAKKSIEAELNQAQRQLQSYSLKFKEASQNFHCFQTNSSSAAKQLVAAARQAEEATARAEAAEAALFTTEAKLCRIHVDWQNQYMDLEDMKEKLHFTKRNWNENEPPEKILR